MLVSDPALRPLVSRAFNHGEMKKASEPFAANRLPADLAAVTGPTVPPDLQIVARCFANLQPHRHDADYKIDRIFTRGEVLDLVGEAEEAFEAWARIRKQPIARVYLVSLLIWARRR
jgi:hypothetical protein